MTEDDYRRLLQTLAHDTALSDPAPFIESGCVRVGDAEVQLDRDPDDPAALQVRVRLGSGHDPRALLRANYDGCYAGDRVISLSPMTAEAVLTTHVGLADSTTARDLWLHLSRASAEAARARDDIAAAARPRC
jgi:hypothetical protein